MKKLFIIFLSLCSIGATAQFPAHPDSIYTFIKYNSVWSNSIRDWQPVDAAFKKEIAAAKTDKDTLGCFVSVLRQLNDVHSYFIYKGRYYGHYKPVDSLTNLRTRPILRRAREEEGRFTTALLPDGIVYVRVPAISAYGNEEVNQFAQALYDSVYQYASKKPRGFIVDLRLNSGGNMYPMLAGLSSLLGDTVLGFETDMNGTEVRKWETRKGNFFTGGYQVTDIRQPGQAGFEKLPVAVITGPVTGSSGSMTAIAFKQRKHSIFIGESTADGYTTSNGYFEYPPTLLFLFAMNFAADRNRNLYKHFVPVDIVINGADNFDELLDDKKVKAALQWLSQK